MSIRSRPIAMGLEENTIHCNLPTEEKKKKNWENYQKKTVWKVCCFIVFLTMLRPRIDARHLMSEPFFFKSSRKRTPVDKRNRRRPRRGLWSGGLGTDWRWVSQVVVDTQRLFHLVSSRAGQHPPNLGRHGPRRGSDRRSAAFSRPVVDVPVLGLVLQSARDVVRLGAAAASGADRALGFPVARRRLVHVRVPLWAGTGLVTLVVRARIRICVTIPSRSTHDQITHWPITNT